MPRTRHWLQQIQFQNVQLHVGGLILIITLQTAAAVKYRDCSNITAKSHLSHATVRMSSCSTNLKKIIINIIHS